MSSRPSPKGILYEQTPLGHWEEQRWDVNQLPTHTDVQENGLVFLNVYTNE